MRAALLSLVLSSCVLKFRARLYPLPIVSVWFHVIPPVFQGGSHVCFLAQLARRLLRSARRSSRRSHAHSYASCKASALSLARFARCPLDWPQLLALCSRRYLPSWTARVGCGFIVFSTFTVRSLILCAPFVGLLAVNIRQTIHIWCTPCGKFFVSD